MRVRFLGASDEQVKWGGGEDPRKHLVVGEIYEVDRSCVRSWFTLYTLAGFPKYGFNSVCFETVAEEPLPVPAIQKKAEPLEQSIAEEKEEKEEETPHIAYRRKINKRTRLRRAIDRFETAVRADQMIDNDDAEGFDAIEEEMQNAREHLRRTVLSVTED